MKKSFFSKSYWAVALGLLAGVSACKKDDNNNVIPDDTRDVVVVSGVITQNTTWTKDKVYLLRGFVRVGTDTVATPTFTPATPTLTIEPGTVILGDRESKGTLIIQRGAKIIADGTAAEPIIMTSERSIGNRRAGDWGGLVVCGKARNNVSGESPQLEGGYRAFHGGTDDNDNSGIIRYVRIEYAGIAIQPNQEVNSLTMGSVGRGTIIENVQTSFGLDDAFEWFGGSVNCKNLVAFACLDDDFDVDLGYNGNVQFALSIKDPLAADQSGSNGFEVDNNGGGTATTLVTSPIFSNVTIIGPKSNREVPISLQYQSAAQLRRGNNIKIYNSFFTGYPNGIFLDNNGEVLVTSEAAAGRLVLKGNVLAGVDNWGGNGFGSAGSVFGPGTPANGANHSNNPRGSDVLGGTATFANGVYTVTPANVGSQTAREWFLSNNTILDKWQDAGINANIFAAEGNFPPAVLPNSGAALLSGAVAFGTAELPSTFFTTVTFRGAFGTDNWTANWTEWNPNVVAYPGTF
jgi:hypothetical protein